MALMPKRVRHRKSQRGRIKGEAQRGNRVVFGDFGLQATQGGWIAATTIESGRVAAQQFGNVVIADAQPARKEEAADADSDAANRRPPHPVNAQAATHVFKSFFKAIHQATQARGCQTHQHSQGHRDEQCRAIDRGAIICLLEKRVKSKRTGVNVSPTRKQGILLLARRASKKRLRFALPHDDVHRDRAATTKSGRLLLHAAGWELAAVIRRRNAEGPRTVETRGTARCAEAVHLSRDLVPR